MPGRLVATRPTHHHSREIAMTIALVSFLRRLAARATAAACTASGRLAVIVGIAVAIGSSAHS
jgi:hypothetical protein